MTFKTQIANDFYNGILNTNETAEEIIYTPYGGSAKTIKAFVTRFRVDANPHTNSRLMQNQARVRITNHSTYGVDVVKKGFDKVTMPLRPGDSSIDWAVVEISGKNSGFWTLIVQR